MINSGGRASSVLNELVNFLDIPVTNTLMGLGSIPASNKRFLGMLGMHGTYEANMAMYECDLMICIGARFDDRVTGKIESFSPKSKKIHIDIDPSSINKNIKVDYPVIGDAGIIMGMLLKELRSTKRRINKSHLLKWWNKIELWRKKDCLSFKDSSKIIKPQRALKELNLAIKGMDAYITTEVGQHQMWAAQYLEFNKPNLIIG